MSRCFVPLGTGACHGNARSCVSGLWYRWGTAGLQDSGLRRLEGRLAFGGALVLQVTLRGQLCSDAGTQPSRGSQRRCGEVGWQIEVSPGKLCPPTVSIGTSASLSVVWGWERAGATLVGIGDSVVGGVRCGQGFLATGLC